jgi:Phage tail sheath protein subtilisin-like domain/Phage tail sheath C-terminal domain
MAFQVSPGVNVSEIDLTTAIPAVSVSTGAIAGAFNWGPALTPTVVTSEVDLVNQFGKPDNTTAGSFFTGANFLSYSNDLRVVRLQAQGANNATASGAGLPIINHDDYINNHYVAATIAAGAWTARYLGSMGNSLEVIVWNSTNWAANTTSPADPLYQFATQFDHAPGTSPYVQNKTGLTNVNDEIHIAVVDATGLISGVANTLLEKYQAVSVLSDAKDPSGGNNYYKEVILRNSHWVYWTGHPTGVNTGWGTTIASIIGGGTIAHDSAANTVTLAGGTDGTILTGNTTDAINVFTNTETTDISLLMMGDAAGNTTATGYGTVSNAVLQLADTRKDCVAFVSPALANVQLTSGVETSVAGFAQNSYLTSYGVMDSSWKYQYDKYNDVYRWVPLNGDIAGLCANTDNVRDPWWSPAGLQRGMIKNVVKLAFNPTKAQRDVLYKAGVNPVVSFPGEGVLLFGDKTLQNRASAFDRINVRRLFIVLEKAISKAARSSLFEFNDAFTRSQFVNLVAPFLRTVQSRRGIYDFKVVCDESNNTPDIIDANQFVGDIYIKPARSINFIQLNFVAVRTGVAFNEVVGKF